MYLIALTWVYMTHMVRKKESIKGNTHSVDNLRDIRTTTNHAWTLSLSWSNSYILAIKVRYGRTL